MRVAFAVVVAVVLGTGLLEGEAAADARNTSGYVYASSFDCVRGLARIADGTTGGGFARATVTSEKGGSLGDCTVRFSRPPGLLANQIYYYKWRSANGQWYVCRRTDWYYNKRDVYKYSVYVELNTPCGNGHYATQAGTFMYNGSWRGGWLTSPSHYF